jgi:hypothetical protein
MNERRPAMPSAILIGLVFIPSMILVFVMLTTFYGATRAYLAISWLPLLFILTIWVFTRILAFQHLSDQWWLDLARAVRWAALVQVALGVGLIVRALCQRKGAISLALGTALSASPWLLRFTPS